MSLRLTELRAKALKLDPKERAALAHDLIESLDSLSKAEVAELWRIEAERRREEVQAGKVRTIPGDEVLGELDSPE